MASLKPVVLEKVDIVSFIQYVLDHHAPPTTLLICSSKDAFLDQLHSAASEPSASTFPDVEHEDPDQPDAHRKKTMVKPWSIPTLHLVASSRTVKLVFCPDVTHVRAHLAAYAHQPPRHQQSQVQTPTRPGSAPMLAILNCIQLHRPTSAFSAQGLNRTFSIAVEAAYRKSSRLVFAECAAERESPPRDDILAGEEFQSERAPLSTTDNVWNEEVSILNVTTKTFGAGERGWVGRTVKIRSIAGRWCEFQALDHVDN